MIGVANQVTVVEANYWRPTLQLDASNCLTAVVEPDRNYQVEFTESLSPMQQDWRVQASVYLSSEEVLRVPLPTNYTQRFFRIRSP